MTLATAYKYEMSKSRIQEKIKNRFYERYQYDRTHNTWKINGIQYEFTMSERNVYNEYVCKIMMKTGKTKAAIQLNMVIVDKELTKEEAWDICFNFVYFALGEGRWLAF